MSSTQRPELAFHLLVLALVLGAAALMVPFWPWLLLGLWFALFARRFLAPVACFLGGRRRAAALLTMTLLIVVIAPVVLIVVPLAADAVGLVEELLRAGDGRNALETLVSPGGPSPNGAPSDFSDLLNLVGTHGAKVWAFLRMIAGATTKAVLGLVVFVVTAYGSLTEGPAAYAWVKRHAPIDAEHLDRFGAAFRETGRGLFFGIGGAGLVQSIIATIAYLALGVPRAISLGFLTLLGSVIPGIGTGIVWAPVAFGLFLTHRPVAAGAMLLIGLFAIGTVDNIVKPLLARYGHLELPGAMVVVSMFGGLLVVGPWGLLLGPLLARLAKEGLVLLREERDRAEEASEPGRRSEHGEHLDQSLEPH